MTQATMARMFAWRGRALAKRSLDLAARLIQHTLDTHFDPELRKLGFERAELQVALDWIRKVAGSDVMMARFDVDHDALAKFAERLARLEGRVRERLRAPTSRTLARRSPTSA